MNYNKGQTLWLKDSSVINRYAEVTFYSQSAMFPERIIVDTQDGARVAVIAADYTDTKTPRFAVADPSAKPFEIKIESQWRDTNNTVWTLTTVTPNGNLIFESDDDIISSKSGTLPIGFKPNVTYQDTYAALIYDKNSGVVFYNCFRLTKEETEKAVARDWKGSKILGIVRLSAEDVEVVDKGNTD